MSFNDEYLELRKKRKKEQEANVKNSVQAPLFVNKTAPLYNNDIAPVSVTPKQEEKEERTWFKSGAFDDGYQFGDVTKTILGTAGDAAVGMAKGIGYIAEGVGDLASYGGAYVADKLGFDDTADNIRKRTQDSVTDMMFGGLEKATDKYSVLGDRSDSVAQGLGQVASIIVTGGLGGMAGLGAVGTTALTTGLMGASSMGSGISEAYIGGATDEEAATYGLIKGVVDAGSELIFGGLGKTVKALGISKGLSSLDDMFAQKLASRITNRVAKNFVEYGVKASAEGVEEVLAGIGSAVAKKLTYMKEEELSALIKDENLLEQFVAGAVTSGVAQFGVVPGMKSGSFLESVQQDRDFVSGLSTNEQKVVDKEYADRVAEAEKDGEVSKKEKDKIYDAVISDMERGYISTDTIEEVLGGDTYNAYKSTVASEDALSERLTFLGNKTTPTLAEQTEYAELKAKLDEVKKTSKRSELKSKLGEEVFGLVQKDRLLESYNERGRRSQAFEADLTKYDAKSQATIKKAVESGILNNTRRTHEFVDMIAKISADKGVLFDFTNNEKLKNSAFAVGGKIVNGYVTKDGVTLNIDSAKSLNSVVGHEITHVLEGTELYTALQSAVVEYAKAKGEYDSRLADLTETYKNIKDADVNAELTADMIGDYLFTDTDFINNLATNKNVFQKIYDEIKYLCKVSTAGSKEARELEKVKRAFEKAYQESGKNNTYADETAVTQNTDVGGKYGVIENLLNMGRVNNTFANEIIRDAELSKAFTDITGVTLEGTTEQKRSQIRNTVREYQVRSAENEELAKTAAEQAQTEQAIRDGGYTSYIRGIFAKGATVADAREILRNPDMKAEWESITGKTLPTNQKSAIKMIQQTKRNPANIGLPDVDTKYSLSDSDGDQRSYAEITDEQQKLYQREMSLVERKREALNNPELLQAMDDHSNLFSELRSLLPKKRTGTATQAELDRIEEIVALRDERMNRIKELQESLGLNAIAEEEREIRETKEALRVAADAAWAREGAEKENKAIEKSGLSAEEYFRKKALKAFKTTANFNEAGYLLPDGKLLNFSGGERNHRYRDHREIGEIYEATQGTAALNRFLSDGNIRIMAESPGIDLASGVEPTQEQYAALRRFIKSHGATKGQFFVDISGTDGRSVGKYSYEGRVNADRVLNDIKYFYQNGEVREQSSVGQFLSLSKKGEQIASIRSSDIYGKDIRLETAVPETVAPVVNAENAKTTPVVATPDEEEVAPVMPMQETAPKVTEKYEAIKPKREKQPKLAKATPAEQARANVLTEEPKVEKKTGAWGKFKNLVLDKGMVFEDLSLKTGNRELQARWNSIRYAGAKAQQLMENGNASVSSLKSIREAVEATGKTKEFYEYLYHKHNADRMTLAQRYEDTPNKPVFGDSVTSDVSTEAAADLERANPEFKQYAEEVYGYMTYLRELMVDNGVISRETAKLWSEMYPHYVPIRRVGDTGLNINVPLDTGRTGINAPVKRATGGNRDILPLFDTMGQRTMQTYKAIAKNRFGVELKNTLGTTIENEAMELDEVIDGIEHDGLLQEGKDGKKPTFTVFENGKKVTFEITEEMYDSMKPTNDVLASTSKTLNTIGNIRRGTLTEYNPWFLLKNAVKDVQDVLINSQHATRTYAAIPKALKQMATNGHWYAEYMANGGEQNSYFDTQTNTFTEQNKALEIAKTVTGLNAISKANNIIERLPRLAEYIASRELGRSIDVAMLDSARVTTNFAAGGDLTKFLNRNGATFLNASVQGAMQQARNIREAKMNGLKGWASLAGKFIIAGLPALALNHLLWDDDDEYEELSDYVKQNYYIVGKYGDGQFVRIPKGRTVAVIQNAFEQMENAITGNDEVDLKTFLDLVVTNLAPNNPLDNNILSPIVQVANNETWYGEDLVPTRLQDLPNAEQYDESTDSISRWLGEKTAGWHIGDTSLEISPYKANYLLDQYSGVIGDTFLPMLTPEAESGDDSFLGNMIAPLKDMFTTDSVMNNQNVSDFYDKVDELTVNANGSKATDEDVLMSKYMNSVMKENPYALLDLAERKIIVYEYDPEKTSYQEQLQWWASGYDKSLSPFVPNNWILTVHKDVTTIDNGTWVGMYDCSYTYYITDEALKEE